MRISESEMATEWQSTQGKDRASFINVFTGIVNSMARFPGKLSSSSIFTVDVYKFSDVRSSVNAVNVQNSYADREQTKFLILFAFFDERTNTSGRQAIPSRIME